MYNFDVVKVIWHRIQVIDNKGKRKKKKKTEEVNII